MVNLLSAENGATRFVSGSHLRRNGPEDESSEAAIGSDETTLACGPAGWLITNAYILHGHAPWISTTSSVQGHFVARDATAAINYRSRMRPELEQKFKTSARYLLDLQDCRLTNRCSGRLRDKVPIPYTGVRAAQLKR